MCQNAVVYVAFVSVCVSFGGLSEFDWVLSLDRWDIEGGVRVVVAGHMWVVLWLGCAGGKRRLCPCAFVLEVQRRWRFDGW